MKNILFFGLIATILITEGSASAGSRFPISLSDHGCLNQTDIDPDQSFYQNILEMAVSELRKKCEHLDSPSSGVHSKILSIQIERGGFCGIYGTSYDYKIEANCSIP